MRASTKKGGTHFTAPATPTRAQRRASTTAPRVDYLSVPCPDCGAVERGSCISLGESRAPGAAPKGEPITCVHRSRKRIATRRFNEAREAEKNSRELPSESP